MEPLTALRELWRRRLLAGLAALAAIIVGLMLSYRLSLPPQSRSYDVGVASTRILVDTPRSQVVDVAPRGADALGARANLLADVMTDGEAKAAIAHRAGLPPARLFAESALEPETIPPSARRDPQATLLKTRVVANQDGESLPLIEIEARAPDAARAARLADAAVTGLSAYLDSKAAGERVPDARRLQVTGLGPSQAREATHGSRVLIALGVAGLVFVVLCAGILVGPMVIRAWRVASYREAGRSSLSDADGAHKHGPRSDTETSHTPPTELVTRLPLPSPKRDGNSGGDGAARSTRSSSSGQAPVRRRSRSGF